MDETKNELMKKENQKDSGFAWLKQHADTLVILATFASAFWTLNEKMNERFNSIELKLNTIETVLIVKGVMPAELCKKSEKEGK